MAETRENAVHLADGMAMAASVASGTQIAFANNMTPSHAAECMRSMIVKAIRDHAEAIR